MITKILIFGTMECCLFTSFLFSKVLPKRQHFLFRLGMMFFLEMILAFPLLLFRNKVSFYLKSSTNSTLLN